MRLCFRPVARVAVPRMVGGGIADHVTKLVHLVLVAMFAMAPVGCGSTGDEDSLVMKFVRYDSEGLDQADAVRETSADVDVSPSLCIGQGEEGRIEPEQFTQTAINAVFRNEQALDIQLERYTVRVGGNSGLGTFEGTISANLQGGRCANIDRSCAIDDDCVRQTTAGNCVHTETVVSGLLLFDFLTKASVNPEVYGEGLPVEVRFFGKDANQSFEVATSYVTTFDNFNNCE